MKNWFNSLGRFQYAFCVGLGGWIGGLIAALLINLVSPDHGASYWPALGGFLGGFLSVFATGSHRDNTD